MKIERSQVATLLAAHKTITGDLDPKVRYAVSKNLVHLLRAHKETERFRVALVKKLEPETLEVKPDSPKFDEFTNEFYGFLQTDAEISLMPVRFDGLNVEKNAIPPSAVAALEPVLVLDTDAPDVSG